MLVGNVLQFILDSTATIAHSFPDTRLMQEGKLDD
jgi:hypothetical protein